MNGLKRKTRLSSALSSLQAIIAASCGIEPNKLIAYKPLIDTALRIAKHQPDFCLILQVPFHPSRALT